MKLFETKLLSNDRYSRILKRRQIIHRVNLLSTFYTMYRDILLNENILNYENDYTEAEKLSDFVNFLGISQTKPTDFFYDKDKLVDELIDTNIEFNKVIDYCSTNNMLTKRFILAFCKRIEFSFHILRINTQFEHQVKKLTLYSEGLITKDELEDGIKEFSLFSKKRKHNARYFRRTFLAIDKTALEIYSKIKNRTNNE